MELVAYRKEIKVVNYVCPHCHERQDTLQEVLFIKKSIYTFVAPVCCEDKAVATLN